MCSVCHADDENVPLMPCCHKLAHYECCPAPIHLYESLRPVQLILDVDGYRGLLYEKLGGVMSKGTLKVSIFIPRFNIIN